MQDRQATLSAITPVKESNPQEVYPFDMNLLLKFPDDVFMWLALNLTFREFERLGNTNKLFHARYRATHPKIMGQPFFLFRRLLNVKPEEIRQVAKKCTLDKKSI